MRVPTRNTFTGTIMCWEYPDRARAALAIRDDPERKERRRRLRVYHWEMFTAARHDEKRQRQLLEKSQQHGLSERERDELDVITDRWTDPVQDEFEALEDGPDAGHRGPRDAAEYHRKQMNPMLHGDEYLASLLWMWPADMEIDDEPGYVLEDGRRFETAEEAVREDEKARAGLPRLLYTEDDFVATSRGCLTWEELKRAASQDDEELGAVYQQLLDEARVMYAGHNATSTAL